MYFENMLFNDFISMFVGSCLEALILRSLININCCHN